MYLISNLYTKRSLDQQGYPPCPRVDQRFNGHAKLLAGEACECLGAFFEEITAFVNRDIAEAA